MLRNTSWYSRGGITKNLGYAIPPGMYGCLYAIPRGMYGGVKGSDTRLGPRLRDTPGVYGRGDMLCDTKRVDGIGYYTVATAVGVVGPPRAHSPTHGGHSGNRPHRSMSLTGVAGGGYFTRYIRPYIPGLRGRSLTAHRHPAQG